MAVAGRLGYRAQLPVSSPGEDPAKGCTKNSGQGYQHPPPLKGRQFTWVHCPMGMHCVALDGPGLVYLHELITSGVGVNMIEPAPRLFRRRWERQSQIPAPAHLSDKRAVRILK